MEPSFTAILVFFTAHWVLSVFAQTFFLHRYASHKMFTMNKFWEKFFYIFTLIAQGTSFLNPFGYAVMHRMHHSYSDTDKDPHSPHFYTNVFSMMWKTKAIYSGLNHGRIEAPAEFSKDIPRWPIVDKLFHTWVARVIIGSMYVLYYYTFVPAGMEYLYLLLPVHFVMGPIHGAIVNWGGHKYGYRNFDNTGDKSKNSLPFDFLTMGELFQNNHHGKPTSPVFSVRWFEIDPAYQVMRVLSWLRIIKLERPTKSETVSADDSAATVQQAAQALKSAQAGVHPAQP